MIRIVAIFVVMYLARIPAYAQVLGEATFTAADDKDGADILGAFTDSLKLLMIEHGSRVAFQEKTRRELSGNFWSDYRRSVRIPNQWEDTDAWWVNYIGHPIHGAAAGYIWLDHEPGAPSEISLVGRYWASRARATAWSATYSLQFEVGPLSEASIGNVGMRPQTTGWVDHVEQRLKNRVLRILVRLATNPGRTLSNTASGRVPWHRDGRPVNWR
jgi:hypothetical protein